MNAGAAEIGQACQLIRGAVALLPLRAQSAHLALRLRLSLYGQAC
jgi:hypothetical protein